MLEARDLYKSFGGVVAIDGVNLSLCPGEVIGLVGPNGSGKTTLLDILRGRVKPDKGIVLLEGEVLSVHPFVGLNGTAGHVFRSYQVPRVFPAHTVGENSFLGQWGVSNEAYHTSEVDAVIGTIPNPSQLAGTLSVGQRRRLILSWLYQRLNTVKFFLLDEPSAGGDAEYVSAMLEFIRAARSKGKGLLVVEHNQQILSAVADRFLNMQSGQCHAGVLPPLSSLLDVQTLNPPAMTSMRGLRVQDLTVARNGAAVIRGISLTVAPGEILGVMGPNGCGKSTLLLALYGDPSCKYLTGDILNDRDKLPPQSIATRIRLGIHLLPQEGGTFNSMTVAETLQASLESCCQEQINMYRMKDVAWKVPHVERIWKRRCGALSGGERRLVGLARILTLNPRYALLDEPSAGLDEKSQRSIAKLITELASKGVGIVLAEQMTSYLRGICSREIYI